MPKNRIPKHLREGQITPKDMSVLREGDSVLTQHKKSSGVLRDYTLQHHVSLRWNLNEEAINDFMFELKIDDYTVILDSEELLRYLRWV